MQSADEFDEWLDLRLRELFSEYPGKPLAPEVKALIEPRPKKPKPK